MVSRRSTVLVWLLTSCFVGLVALSASRLNASDRFVPVIAEELALKSEPLAPGAPAVILYRQVDRIDGYNSREDHYVRIKILTEAGRKYADIEIPFHKSNQDVVDIKSRTVRPDGSIVNFTGRVFEKSLYKNRGVKYQAKTFTLPDVQVGSIVEYQYSYVFKDYYIYDSHWILSDDLFTRVAKFSLKPFDPPNAKIFVRFSWQGLPPNTPPPGDGPDHIIRLEAHNIPAFQTEQYMPPENEMKARVDFIYSLEPPQGDSDLFWKQVGRKRYDQLESFINKRGAMEHAVAETISPNDTPEVKLQKLYTRVQQFRNISFEVRKTQQEAKRENEKEIKNVEDLWKRGYGNGTDLTFLYLALVKAAGFEAYGVWVSDRKNYFFNPKQMDAFRLDANVMMVRLNGKDIYCDPGDKYAPFGFLPWYETGVKGLKVEKDGGSWIQTPVPASSESVVSRQSNLKLTDTGDLEGKLTLTYTGLEALNIRSEENNEDDADRKQFLEDRVKNYIAVGSDVELTNKPAWSDPDAPLVAEFDLKIPGWASGVGHRVMLPIGIFGGTEKHTFERAGRVHPIYLEFPFQRVDNITIELPSGWQVSSLPPINKQDGHIINYVVAVENDKGKLHLTRTLDSNFLILSSQYYPALQNFFKAVRTGDEQQIVMLPGVATAAN